MRLATITYSLLYALNMALVAAVAALGLWLWMHDAASVGMVAVALSLALRLLGLSHWIMWELSALFENIVTVHDAINSISIPPTVHNAPDESARTPERGDVSDERRAFH